MIKQNSRIFIFLILILSIFSCLAITTRFSEGSREINSDDQKISLARQSLKDYGLFYCLANIDLDTNNANTHDSERKELQRDLSATLASLHFMGRGTYRIAQNEDTLETIHDPYLATEYYFEQHIQNHIGTLKSGYDFKSIGCLEIYHSKAFNEFIISEDQYIDFEYVAGLPIKYGE